MKRRFGKVRVRFENQGAKTSTDVIHANGTRLSMMSIDIELRNIYSSFLDFFKRLVLTYTRFNVAVLMNCKQVCNEGTKTAAVLKRLFKFLGDGVRWPTRKLLANKTSTERFLIPMIKPWKESNACMPTSVSKKSYWWRHGTIFGNRMGRGRGLHICYDSHEDGHHFLTSQSANYHASACSK